MRDAIQTEIKSRFLPQVIAVLKRYGKSEYAEELAGATERYGNRTVTLDISEYEVDLLTDLAAVFEEDRTVKSFILSYAAIVSDVSKAKVKKLTLLPDAIWRYLVKDAIDGWLYEEILDGVHVAYVVDSIDYHSARNYQNDDYVSLKLKANKAEFDGEDDGLLSKIVTFHRGDLGERVGIVLLTKGLLKETEELKATYLEHLAKFEQLRPMQSKQFLCSGTALDVSANSWWRSQERYDLPHPTKMVNDEEILGRKITISTTNYHIAQYGVKESSKQFARIPVHPFLLFFDLTRHVNCWVHVNNCEPYVYDPTLKDKLVLPERHRDLIDVLTTDMDIFTEDIIAGKSGGTALLCFGAPGLGKTLTAEVYSEVVERPLYRVHAGQLGVDVSSVENALETILRRAERWGAVLLLDEADVYIRRRGDDMQHNAVVAAFLRTLEYFHGLLFLTTNRENDVDDAILSRMIAMFKYDTPDENQARALWSILSRQFGIKISDKAITGLIGEFPKASGRDIKQLLKLTMKYCKYKQIPLSIEAFRVCAMFRGVI